MPIRRLTYAAIGIVALLTCQAVPFYIHVCHAESGHGGADKRALQPAASEVPSAETETAMPPMPDPIAPVSLPSASSLEFPEALDRGSDVVLLVDGSTAMERTDPSGSWKGAVKLFISLLGDEDRVAIISFGREADERISLTQNIGQNRPALLHAVESISAGDGAEGMSDGALKGFKELGTSARRNRFLVLVAGGSDAGPEGRGAPDLLRMVPELKKARIRMYALAAAERSDRALLENAAYETGGFFRSAQTGGSMHVLLTALFEEIRRPDTLPFAGASFAVDPDVREAVVVAAKKPGAAVTLVGPTGRRETAAKHGGNTAWYTSAFYDLITLRKPAAGSWRTNMDAEGSRIFIATDLNLQVYPDKSAVKRGETVTFDAWLEQRGGPASGKVPAEAAAFFAEVSGPGGVRETLGMTPRSPSTPPAHLVQGPYSAMISCSAPGSYQVTVTAQCRTFLRKKSLSFTVVDDSVTLTSGGNDRKGADGMHISSPGETGFSWPAVLLKLVLVNLAAGGLAAVVIVVRMLIVKMRTRI